MKPIVQTVRAIGAEFIRRMLRPILLVGAAVAVLLLVAGVWLVNQNVWWWLLLAVIIAAVLVFVVLVTVASILVKLADSVQSRDQRTAVRRYVDMLQRASENLQTPYPVILYRVVRDMVWPRPDGFIATLSQDSQALAPDFKALLALFD